MAVGYSDLRKGDRVVLYFTDSRVEELLVREASGRELALEHNFDDYTLVLGKDECARVTRTSNVRIKNLGNRGIIGQGNHVRVELKSRDVYLIERERQLDLGRVKLNTIIRRDKHRFGRDWQGREARPRGEFQRRTRSAQ